MNKVEMLTESLVNELKNTNYMSSYSSVSSNIFVLSAYDKNEVQAAESTINKWLTEFFNDNILELEQYKQRVMFLEEMVKKSNFAPMIDDSPKGEELIDILLDRLKQDNYNVFSNDCIIRLADRVEQLLFQECEEK